MAEDKEKVEINLLEFARKLWNKKKFILKGAIIGVVVGIIIAFSIPKQYTTTVILTSESGNSSGGSMGALASIAGLNWGGGNGSEIFSPELYPDVLNSTPFVQGLLEINVSDINQNIDTTLYSYIKDNQKVAWWSYILGVPRLILNFFSLNNDDKNFSSRIIKNKYFISKEDMNVIEALRSSYLIITDKKTGLTTLEATAQSPSISAFLADTLTSYLQSYIIKERTKKAKTDSVNTEKLYTKAKTDYYNAQQNLASFIDQNRNITSAIYRINQEKLQQEATIKYSLYSQMAQQVQMDNIKIQDNTPVFTIIQPAIEPIFPSAPKKKLIFIAFVLLALVASACWVLRDDLKAMIVGNGSMKDNA